MADVRTTVLSALRVKLTKALGLRGRDVGGWEMVANREVSLAVYAHGGTIGPKPGGTQFTDTCDLKLVLTVRGDNALSEDEAFVLANSMLATVNSFTHPLLAGAQAKRWDFDIAGDNSFDNILTVSGQLAFKAIGWMDPAKTHTLAREVLLSVQQKE
ncbi:hypothetical protein [Deinococcus kurensis]|uniref:hypothetical protein n=1 Tax=Deinococcus kurensis TaxID=2662757 RepID=UPI0012D3700D|nr:hypothetical protein [Deinococcus kurensis]